MVESLGLLVIFWYGVLHAFGPDHLTAIADFSIGKERQKTMMITGAFAVGHGFSLFLFAKILEFVALGDDILAYADIISAGAIIVMGIYLLFLVVARRIHVGVHGHGEKQHVHIWIGQEHTHDQWVKKEVASVFTIGLLMGIGGVRGMLVTLSLVAHQGVDGMMILSFTLGVATIFVCFGAIIAWINQRFLSSTYNVRVMFATAGVVSIGVGSSILCG